MIQQSMILRRQCDQPSENPKAQSMIETMIRQYYNFTELLGRTQWLAPKQSLYQGIKLDQYDSSLSIIGRIYSIETVPETGLPKQMYFPVVTSPLPQQPNLLAPSPLPTPRNFKLALAQDAFDQKTAIDFNRITTACKKYKDKQYIFTHLDLMVHKGQICFELTQKTWMIELGTNLYENYFQHVEHCLLSNYSSLSVGGLWDLRQLCYYPQELRKVTRKVLRVSICGAIEAIDWDQERVLNQKQRQVQIILRQESFKVGFREVGVCKVLLRYELSLRQKVMSFIEQGWVYIMTAPDILITNDFQVSFKLTAFSNRIMKVRKVEQGSLQNKYKEMKVSPLAILSTPDLLRNHYKFSLYKLEVKKITAKVIPISQPVSSNVKMEQEGMEAEHIISKDPQNWTLKMSAILTAMDNSDMCHLSLEDNQVLSFFDLQGEANKLKQHILKEQTEHSLEQVEMYWTVVFSEFSRSHSQPSQQGTIYEANPYIQDIVQRCLIESTCKEVIAVPQNRTEKNYKIMFGSKNQNMQRFIEYRQEKTRKAQMFPNGAVRFSGVVPCLRVIQVVS